MKTQIPPCPLEYNSELYWRYNAKGYTLLFQELKKLLVGESRLANDALDDVFG